MSTADPQVGTRVMICWPDAPREFGTVVAATRSIGAVRVAVDGRRVVNVAAKLVKPADIVDEVAGLAQEESDS